MIDKAKVCIVITPSPFLADERVFPSLGPLKVAACLEKAGHEVDVLDLSGIKNFTDVIASYMNEPNRAYLIGLSAATPQFPQAVRILERIKDHDPETRVILGGAHATMVGSARQLDKKKGVVGRGTRAAEQMTALFDVVVVGDGEKAVFGALDPDSPRVIDAGERTSPYFLQRGTLEQYPLPARHLIDFESYHYDIDGMPAQSLIAQLGCPFECGFCGGRNTQSFRLIRTRTTESILEEIDELVFKYGSSEKICNTASKVKAT
jgi:radical SAM superfamily enzyme YgiQ (UPF0313 family)